MSGSVPFPIVVFGDSIMWGQGLRPGPPAEPDAPSDKMAELVGVALATNPSVVQAGATLAPQVFRFAQSGAQIPGSQGSVAAITQFPAGEVPAGAVPNQASSILDQSILDQSFISDQVAGAPAALLAGTPPIAASAVNLVLLNGGINDVGLASILDPLVSSSEIATTTNAKCLGPMSALLEAVGQNFPNAIVVVTGYYDIVSSSSDVTGLLVAAGLLAGDILAPGGWVVSVLAGTIVASVAKSNLNANCSTFKQTSDSALASAVADANNGQFGSLTVANTTFQRFLFVEAPFTAENALFTRGRNGADEQTNTAPAFLWGFDPSPEALSGIIDRDVLAGSIFGGLLFGPFGSVLGALDGAAKAINTIVPMLTAVDEVVSSRTGPGGVCAAAGLSGGNLIGCDLASVGHPNREGEAAYANAIATRVSQLQFVELLSAASSQGCLIVTAALGSPQAEQVDRLRKLRDEFISRSRLGKDFFAAASKEYYAFSPIIAARMHASTEFKDRVRRFAISPFLGFVELLRSWAAGLDAEEFQEVLTSTLDASLKDLANAGIAAGQVGAAAKEMSRLAVHQAHDAGLASAEVDAWGVELANVVNYFNAVVDQNVPGDGRYLDVMLLQPLKLYWRLLCARAVFTPPASILSEFDAGMTHWLASANVLASLSRFSMDDLSADLQVLYDMLSAKHLAHLVFEASLLANDRGAGTDASEIRQDV
jgi:hypothetical protein